MTGVAEAEHILVTSYPPHADPVATVERVAALADLRLVYWLPDGTGVAERFAAGPVVSIRPCSRSGKPKLEEPVREGRASVVTEGPVFDEAKAAIKGKYGLAATVAGAVDRARELLGERTPEAVVVIDVVS
ncbi:hypothetical protein [Raineyella sp. W15-4]|uniref:hypothetical protein n=1 Tax=Raineyella sp. W15-4 TaxID=3081651 RepID=UPI002953D907|nr:hypothetical protein [Raineyella sp. W15-4]WOQ16985.1 hypothetical protein R0145_17560 [Raineyella sp. W15-4]